MDAEEDHIAVDLKPLMTAMGEAILICQAFEESLCFLHAQMSHEEAMGESGAFEASWDFHSSKTLGGLLTALRKRIDIPEELGDFLEKGVQTRNRIVHGFLTQNMGRLITPQGQICVIEELNELKLEVKRRDVVANKLLDALFQKYGFSNEDLKKQASESYAALNRKGQSQSSLQ